MISRELLSKVLGVKVWKVLDENMGTVRYCIYPNKGDEPSDYMFPINIYELTHKCKEWAMQTPYIVDQLAINIDRTCLPNKFKTRYWCVWLLHHSKVSEEFYADTEPEAIIEACQWLLEELKK